MYHTLNDSQQIALRNTNKVNHSLKNPDVSSVSLSAKF